MLLIDVCPHPVKVQLAKNALPDSVYSDFHEAWERAALVPVAVFQELACRADGIDSAAFVFG